MFLERVPVFNTFDEYVAAYPEAEQYRRWLGKKKAIFLPCLESQDGRLIGDYVWAKVGRYFQPSSIHHSPFWVHVNNCDDSCAKKFFSTRAQAEKEIEVLKAIAPVSIHILTMVSGYVLD